MEIRGSLLQFPARYTATVRRSLMYYPNRDNAECFPSAFANLLIELGEDLLASVVYQTFWRHPLTRPHLSSLYLLTRYVEDLTSGAYIGHLTLAIPPTRTRRLVAFSPSDRRKAYEEEVRKGRIVHAKIDTIPIPSIVVIRRQTSHAMTYIGKDQFIDDGQLVERDASKLDPVGAMTIERSEAGAAEVTTAGSESERSVG